MRHELLTSEILHLLGFNTPKKQFYSLTFNQNLGERPDFKCILKLQWDYLGAEIHSYWICRVVLSPYILKRKENLSIYIAYKNRTKWQMPCVQNMVKKK